MTNLNYTPDNTREIQIGLIVLQADETLEMDMRRLLPDGVNCLVSRVPSGEELTPETLRSMEKHLSDAASLLPRGATFSAVGYGCTSGTAEIGVSRIAELTRQGVDTPAVTEPVSALIEACAHLDVHRIGLISPYIARVSNRLCDILKASQITVDEVASFNEATEANVVRIPKGALLDAAVEKGSAAECDAVFLSCTNLRTLDVIEAAEAAIGKPVLSSNQVLAWHMMRLANITPPDDAPGALFRTR